MLAAIIDDGINTASEYLTASWFVDADLTIKPYVPDEVVDTHADTCFKIIRKYGGVCSDVSWHSIKVLDVQSRRGNVDSLIRALEFCEETGVKLIHLSIGTRHFMEFERIDECVSKLAAKGIIIVAALSNAGIITYPACMPQVIGVKHSKELSENEYLYEFNPKDGIEFEAATFHSLEDGTVTKRANSHAAPLITACIADFLCKNPNVDIYTVHDYLIQNSINAKKFADIEVVRSIPRISSNPRNALMLNLLSDDSRGVPSPFQGLDFPYPCRQIDVFGFDTEILGGIESAGYDRLIINFCCEHQPLEKILGTLQLSENMKIFVYGYEDVFDFDMPHNLHVYEPLRTDSVVFRTRDIGIPVIVLLGFDFFEQVKLLQTIRCSFNADGYYCLPASDFEKAKMLGIDAIPSDLDLYSYCREARGFFDCDVLLLGINSEINLENLDEAFSIFIINRNYPFPIPHSDKYSVIDYDEYGNNLYEDIRNILKEE